MEHHWLPDDLPRWTIASEPELRLGRVDGPGPDLFGQVQGLVWRSDGSVVVADGQALEISAFAPSGAHLWTAEGEGGGPGEFGRVLGTTGIIRLALLPEDSVLVFDSSNRRL